ncbi:MAG: PTS sugar transporter subunit IIA, partial [Deltaproteobacteria bacterium]|nr:PTS sugar transporter subunit IIA [Deltaproteobacteria bacterium]
TILRFAREYRVGHIVLGSPAHVPFWKRITGEKSIPERLMDETQGMTIVVLDTRLHEQAVARKPVLTEEMLKEPLSMESKTPAAVKNLLLSSLLDRGGIILWEDPVTKDEALEVLVKTLCREGLSPGAVSCLQAVREREAQGSTFFNEGVAFPHARIGSLAQPLAALGLTRMGITDIVTEKPVEYVFLSLSPLENPDIQLELLALASRALQNRYLRQALQSAGNAADAYLALQTWEKQ